MPRISNAERERRAALAGAATLSGADTDNGDAQPDTNDNDQTANEPEGPELIVMERDGMFADVHPLEVENYAHGGWRTV